MKKLLVILFTTIVLLILGCGSNKEMDERVCAYHYFADSMQVGSLWAPPIFETVEGKNLRRLESNEKFDKYEYIEFFITVDKQSHKILSIWRQL